MSASTTSPADTLFRHAGRAASAVVRAQWELVRVEARQDSGRVVGALVCLAAALACFALAVVALHVAVAWWLGEQLGVLRGVLVVALVDAGLGTLLVAVSRHRLRKPFLGRARSLARQTAQELSRAR